MLIFERNYLTVLVYTKIIIHLSVGGRLAASVDIHHH